MIDEAVVSACAETGGTDAARLVVASANVDVPCVMTFSEACS